MIRHIQPNKLINSEAFIREPVDEITNKIINSQARKIVLDGNRSNGKTVILNSLENRGLGTNTQTILTRADPTINFSIEPKEEFDEKFFKHYYEVIICWDLLRYIKNNYILTYEKSFKDFKEMLKPISSNLDYYMNNFCFENVSIERYLTTGEISEQIIKRLKEVLKIDNLNIAVDRFDWANGASSYTQLLYSFYFTLFDKAIITTDDETLTEEHKNNLKHYSYDFITPNYGSDFDTIKAIIKSRIKLYNQKEENINKRFDESIIPDDIYRKLIDQTDGNLETILYSFADAANYIDWCGYPVEDIDMDDLFNRKIKYKAEAAEKVKKMSANPPKFHL